MTANRISVSTTKTLHNPVEVEINGTVYTVRINKPVFEQIARIEKKLKEVKTEADTGPAFDSIFLLYDEVELMTGAPRADIEQVDFQDLRAIIEFIMAKYYGKAALLPPAPGAEEVKPEPKPLTEEQQEKNGPEVGGNPSP